MRTITGEVEVTETPGGGATFRVLLPLLPRAKDAATAHKPD